MADGTQVVAGTGDTIWTEDTGDVRGKIQRTKIALGVLDNDAGDVSATQPMPSQVCDGTTPAQKLAVDSSGRAAVSVQATPVGGATPYHYISQASTNATNLKASAGTVYTIEIFNNNSSARYMKLFDKATAPTVGTDTPVKTILVPGSSGSGTGVVRSYPVGVAFQNGIGFAVTGAMADSDTTTVTAGDLVLDIDYK